MACTERALAQVRLERRALRQKGSRVSRRKVVRLASFRVHEREDHGLGVRPYRRAVAIARSVDTTWRHPRFNSTGAPAAPRPARS